MYKNMKSYELFLILSTHISEEGRDDLLDKLCEIINASGNVECTDNWGKRHLARPINKETDGFYTVIKFKATNSVPAELNRVSSINDDLLRSLVLSS